MLRKMIQRLKRASGAELMQESDLIYSRDPIYFKIKSLSPFFMATTLAISISPDVCFASECKISGWGYAIHDDRVYYGWHDPSSTKYTDEYVVPDADALTFKIVDFSCKAELDVGPSTVLDSFGKDKKYVFFERRKVKGADPASFEIIDYGYEKDRSHVYFRGERISDRPEKFHISSDNSNYWTDDKYFYYGSKKMEAEGFSVFPRDRAYAKNKYKVFHQGIPVVNADPKTFVLSDASTPIAKDKHHVFYKDKIITGADPASFQELGYSGMGRDKNSVYIETKSFPEINKDGLKISEFSGYLINSDAVYKIVWDDDSVSLQKLDGVNQKTFQELGIKWAKNDQNVFYEGHQVPGADSASFELISDAYAKDQTYGFAFGKIACIRNPERENIFPRCKSPF